MCIRDSSSRSHVLATKAAGGAHVKPRSPQASRERCHSALARLACRPLARRHLASRGLAPLPLATRSLERRRLATRPACVDLGCASVPMSSHVAPSLDPPFCARRCDLVATSPALPPRLAAAHNQPFRLKRRQHDPKTLQIHTQRPRQRSGIEARGSSQEAQKAATSITPLDGGCFCGGL